MLSYPKKRRSLESLESVVAPIMKKKAYRVKHDTADHPQSIPDEFVRDSASLSVSIIAIQSINTLMYNSWLPIWSQQRNNACPWPQGGQTAASGP